MRSPLRDAVDRDQARRQRHRRAQAEIGAGLPVDHRDAVQRAAGPHPVAVRVGPAEHGGGIGQRARAGQARRRFGEHAQLLARLPAVGRLPSNSSELAKWFISTMSSATPRHRRQPRMRVAHVLGREAEPMHAGVELEPAADRLAAGGLLEHLQLAGVVDDRFDVEPAQLRQVVGLVEARQQHDRLRQAGGAQALGIADSAATPNASAPASARATRSRPWP